MNKYERAISVIKSNYPPSNYTMLREGLDLAISALEKQVPKKAEYHHKANGECALIICPNCENRLTVARYVFRLDRYCKECGQHYVVDIKDWSVEE